VDGVNKSRCRPLCGDGIQRGAESCDDGNLVNGDGCSSNCTVEEGFVCEDNEAHVSVCHKIVCGDGIKEGNEECDDGNLIEGDGCDAECKIEVGYTCRVSKKKSTCHSYCGDGLVSLTEECDDGNVVGGDGCSPTCKVEHGYTCFINYTDPACGAGTCSSLCFATCGDGIVAQEEECDDGNTYQGDGCFNCKVEENWRCRGEPSQCILRKCTLPDENEIRVDKVNILCAGSYSGSFDIFVNSTEEIITKIWRKGTQQPSSFKAALHYSNLPAGEYWVRVSISGFEECFRDVEAVLTEPAKFDNLKGTKNKQFWYTSCDKSDGKISWSPSGGVKPYKFYFAKRPAQNTGTWENVSIREFVLGKPSIVDANNCTAEMSVAKNWPNETSCPDDSVPYLVEGSILLAAAFGAVIIAAIAYSCWSSKRPVPRQAPRK